MRTLMMAIGLAAVCATSATAQATTPATASTGTVAASGDKDCLMRADANAWKTLGLTADQIKRVDDIKARHEKECAAMGEAEGTEKEAAGKCKHEEEVKAVLTAAQYTKWQEWCKANDKKEGSLEKQEKKSDY